MSITEELREWASTEVPYKYGQELLAIANRIDAEALSRRNEAYNMGYNAGIDMGFSSADDWLAQHEDAMAEHGWVRGPLDADGKMWRSGDMSDSSWGVIEGIAYEDGRWLISGHDTSAPWAPADSIRHYHEPTVEDVLREFAEKVTDSQIPGVHPTYEETIAEYAARLRLAGDGEEQ